MKLPEIDAFLMRYADTLSLQAISFKLAAQGVNLTPEQCGSRIVQLLDTPDWLTAAMQDQLVTQKMRQIVVELEELPRTTRNAEVLLNGLEKVGNRLDKRAQATEKDLTRLYAFQGGLFLDAIEMAMAHIRREISAGNVPATADHWDAMLETAIRMAQIELNKHDSDELEPELAPKLTGKSKRLVELDPKVLEASA